MATGNVVAGFPIIAQDVLDELEAAHLAQLHVPVTVANTTAETALVALAIPAGTAVVGAVYHVSAYGILAVTGTPTITFVARVGAAGAGPGIAVPAITVRSGAADGRWDIDIIFTCVSTGVGATWAPVVNLGHNLITSGTTYTTVGPLEDTPGVRDSTVAQSVVLSAIWGTASVSNTLTCRGSIARREA